MAMANYKLTAESGEVSYVQIDESEPVGKAIKEAYDDAVKDGDNGLKSIAKGDPPAANAKGS
jgi:hypothetical protein